MSSRSIMRAYWLDVCLLPDSLWLPAKLAAAWRSRPACASPTRVKVEQSKLCSSTVQYRELQPQANLLMQVCHLGH